MIDPSRVLQPLDEAQSAIKKLSDYESTTDLASAIQETALAVERSLRQLLRADMTAPDTLRLAALSPVELPSDRLIESLRQRNRISLELAGMAHELERSAARAARGEVRAADADVGRRAVERLRSEVHAASEQPMREAAHNAVESGAVEEPARSIPTAVQEDQRHWKQWAIIGGGVLVIVVVGLLIGSSAGFFGHDSDLKKAIAAFTANKNGEAESGFRKVIADDPSNTTALLYLGRLFRKEGRLEEAAEALRRAAAQSPADADVRRELGNLFMDFSRPALAAEQYRQAVNYQREDKRNWIGLVRALRAAGNPQAAEDILHKAPPEVQAELGT
jgi:tetratricopeptide (TPR) repeat protein